MQKPLRDGAQPDDHEDGELPQEAAPDLNALNNIPAVLNQEEETKALCRFFQRGYCRYGEGCRYAHDNAAPIAVPKHGVLTHPRSATPCRFFSKGYCRYGDTCKFAHSGANPAGRFHYGNGNGHVANGAGGPRGEWRFTGEGVNELISQSGKTWDEDGQEVSLGHTNQPYY